MQILHEGREEFPEQGEQALLYGKSSPLSESPYEVLGAPLWDSWKVETHPAVSLCDGLGEVGMAVGFSCRRSLGNAVRALRAGDRAGASLWHLWGL